MATKLKSGMNDHLKDQEPMILEVAILNVKAGEEADFEATFAKAQSIIMGMDGYISHQLQRCLENPSRYVLLVNWQTLKDHTIGFRESKPYKVWKKSLHHYYEPFPTVEHYQLVYGKSAIES